MKVKLRSKCNVKGAVGMPGDIVDIKDEELAKRIIAGHGGREVQQDPKAEENAAKKSS